MTLLLALEGKNFAPPPVWFMRQAGRYLPEYRTIRDKYSFLQMCKTPEIAAEVTKLPIELLGVDAAILFSDILVILEAMGVKYDFIEGVGPVIEHPLERPEDVDRLLSLSVKETLDFVFETCRELRSELTVPLIGFSGGPFTVASYLIEGGSSRDYKKTKEWMLSSPESFHKLLDKITNLTIDYLLLQKKAGAQALQIFDSWAHVLAWPQFEEFSLRYLEKMTRALSETPVILYCRGSSVFAKELAAIGPSGISLDWNASLPRLRKEISGVALQGNLDPDVLYQSKEVIRREVRRIMDGMRGDRAFIFNLGHGIRPDMDPDKVRYAVECVKLDMV